MTTTGTTTSRVWFVTGASRGLGRAFAEAALAAGTGSPPPRAPGSALDELAAAHPGRVLPLTLDVTDRGAVHEAVDAAVAHFGRLDIVVNNAGTLSMGMIEEFTETEARAQMEVNFFGALWVSQAVLPHPPCPTWRAHRAGLQHRRTGRVPAVGNVRREQIRARGHERGPGDGSRGIRCAREHSATGRVLDDLYSAMANTTPIEAYAPLRAQLEAQWAEGSVDSEPALAAEALLRLVGAEEPPLRLLLGNMVYDLAFDLARAKMATWSAWEQTSRAAERAVAAPGSA